MRYFDCSAQRTSVLSRVVSNNESKNKKLKQLCRTRWVERLVSYENIWNLFEEVSLKEWYMNIRKASTLCIHIPHKQIFSFQVIETPITISLSRQFNAESSAAARFFLHALKEFKLIVSLCVSRQLLLHFKSVTAALQGVDVDTVTGFFIVKTISDTLQNVSLLIAHD